MLAYFINKGINIILYHYFLDIYFGNLILFCIIIYGLSYCLSLIFYLSFYYQLVKIKYLDNQLEKQKKRNNYPKIKRRINDDENDTNIKDKYKANIDNNNISNNEISSIQNSEDIKETENNNNYPIFVSLNCPKCNYLLEYDKRRINDNENDTNINNANKVSKLEKKIDNNNISKKENENTGGGQAFLSLICPKIFKKFKSKKYYCASYCASYKLGFRKFFYRTKNTISHYLFCCCDCCKCEECCCCCTCCQCCECCKKLELNEMYQEKEIFCYAYKVQGKCSGFCDLLLKNDFFLLLI